MSKILVKTNNICNDIYQYNKLFVSIVFSFPGMRAKYSASELTQILISNKVRWVFFCQNILKYRSNLVE